MRNFSQFGACSLVLVLLAAAASAQSTSASTQPVLVDSHGLWPVTGTTAIVPVCWEATDPTFEQERRWVRDRVRAEYGGKTPLDFVGWQQCGAVPNNGIRIRIADEQPYALHLGKHLINVAGGVVLNFAFGKWSTDVCSVASRRQSCIEDIAVHEFGHAAGMAHEQNRPDTHGTNTNNACADAPQGETPELPFLAWDPDSVMNYCNVRWNNRGRLSAMDAEGLNELYANTGHIADYGYPDLPQFIADADGDGIRDYCRFVGDAPNIFLSCKLAGIDGFSSGSEYQYNSVSGFDIGNDSLPRYMADVNGDARADYCRLVSAAPNMQLSCNLAGPSGFLANQYGFNSAPGLDTGYANLPRALVDVNGDDRADYCRFVGDAPNLFGSCMLAGTNDFGEQYAFNTVSGIDLGYEALPRTFSDENGDGRADYCRYVGDAPQISLACSTGGTSAFSANQYAFQLSPDPDAYYNQLPSPPPSRACNTRCCEIDANGSCSLCEPLNGSCP